MLANPRILIFTDWFTPAFKAGGPIRSVVNLVEKFKGSLDIYIFTGDRDLHDALPFEGIQTDQWIAGDGCTIYHHSPGKMNYKKVKSVIKEVNPDKIYLNSMFSKMIYPLMAAGRSGKIILAPRGMLRTSALAIKPIRKFLYLSLLRTMNIDQQVTFHSTGDEETKDIKRIFPNARQIIVAPNLPVSVADTLHESHKQTGELHIIFVGRIHPIKNLLFLLESLDELRGDIRLDIVATKDDDAYWRSCEKQIARLKENIKTHIHLDIPHHQIKPLLEQSHLFVLPTEGENFGHAIFEALSVGCPVVLSDQTPWRDLKHKNAGVDLLLKKELFTETIQAFVDMNDLQWQEYRKGALALATDYEKHLESDRVYDDLFKNAE
jgi:glycosyltransferase involved in cell wall biosynthesis